MKASQSNNWLNNLKLPTLTYAELCEVKIGEILKQLNKVWQVEEELNGNKKSQDLARLQKLKTAKSRMVDSLALPENHSIADDIRDNINAKKQEIDKLERSVSESSEQSDSNRADFIEFALGFIDDLGGRLLTLPLKEFDLCKNILFKSGYL